MPHAADAWHVPDSVNIGYEISFTRYFYKPQPLRTLEEIRADILALERETEGLLGKISKRGTVDVLRRGIKHGPHHLDLFCGTPSPGNVKAQLDLGLFIE